jgi:myxalamid-type polyketide synthase MxaE and MxaD
VKTNFGHLEGAAGIAGLIKVVLALRHDAVPSHLHLSRLNPHLSLEGTRLRVPTTLTPWPRGARRRHAGVSAFGWSGTNAHVIVEEGPEPTEPTPPESPSPCELLAISAHSREALGEIMRRYEGLLTSPTVPALADICATAARRRSHHAHRVALVASSPGEMGQQLRAVAWGEAAVGVVTGTVRADRRGRVAFVFSGQGSQWLGMGRSMLALEPAFRDALDRCDAAIARHASWSVLAELAADETTSRLNEIDVVQPALFAIAVGLAALWRSWGVEPGAVIGHSMGEIAAAHVAGALSLDDAARVICRRSQLLRQVKGHGAMAVIDVPPAEAARMLAAQSGRLSVAVATSPRSTVVSGDPEALETLLAALRARDVFCRRVNVDVASHSPQMDPLLEPLQGALDGIAPCDSRLPMYSTVTATRWPGRELGAPYWARNLRDPVLFSATVERLVEDGFTAFVELSPHPLLSAALHEILESLGRDALVLPSLRREEDERAAILCSAAALWTAGHPLNWEHLSRGSRRCVTLPRYPWQHEQFWIERIPASVPADRSRPGPRTAHPVLGSRVELADQPQRHVWELTLDTASALARYHHRLGSTSLLAASAHLGVMAAAARSVLGAGPIRLRDVEFRHALVVPESGSVPLQITAAPDREGSVRISLFTRPGSAWVCHSTAMADRSVGGAAVAATALAASSTTMAGSEIYDALRARGIGIAPALQCIERLSSSATGAVATVTAAERVESDPGREIATLDVCFQLPAVCAAPAGVSSMALPTRLDEVRIYGDGGRARRGEASGPGHVTPAGVRIHDLRLVSDDDRVEIELVGLHLVPPPAGLSASPAAQALYEIQWRRETTSVPSAPAGLCVIFGTDDDLTTALVRRLEQQARRCVVVTPGSAWGESATGGFVVNPTDATEIARALEAGVPSGQELATVVSLWGLRSDIDEDDVTACRHALAVLHGLTRVPRASSTRLWIVTCGAQAVGSPRPLALAQAGLWGLGRVIGEEHPDLWGGLVDLDPEASAEDRAACVADAIAGRREHDQLAYREGHRHVARLVRSQASVAAALALPGDATYLLTGGLGALGLEVARRLVQRGARHLALVSRTPLPSRDRWDDPRNDAGVTRRIAAIRELEVLGAQVHLAAADIGDEKRLQDLIRQLGDAAPPVRGVVHAAAAIDDRLLGHVDAASLERVWRGKVRGAWALHRVLGATPLDFFVLFASLGGVLGQTGQGSYAAANAFLDALAQHRRAMGQVAVSIDWAAWSDLGFAATEGGRRVIVELERRGIKAFSPSQALDVFELVLAQGTSQMMAAAIDWTRFGAARRGGDRLPSLLVDLLGPTTAAAPSHDVEALRALPLVERRRRLQEYVQTDVAAILKLPASRVEAQVPLGTLGLDSLTTLELRRRLERRVGQPLPATLVWNYPTAADLAGYLAGLLSDDTVSTESARARSAPAAAVKHVSDLTEDEALRALLATRRGA